MGIPGHRPGTGITTAGHNEMAGRYFQKKLGGFAKRGVTREISLMGLKF